MIIRPNGIRSRENGLIVCANEIRSRENGLIIRSNGIKSRENELIVCTNGIRSRESEIIIGANGIKSRANEIYFIFHIRFNNLKDKKIKINHYQHLCVLRLANILVLILIRCLNWIDICRTIRNGHFFFCLSIVG